MMICKKLKQITKAPRKIQNLLAQVWDSNFRHSMGMECSSIIICKKLNHITKARRKIQNLLAQVWDRNFRHNMEN